MGSNCSRKSSTCTKDSLRSLPSLVSITPLESVSPKSTLPLKRQENNIDRPAERIQSLLPVQRPPSPETPQSATLENALLVWFTRRPDEHQTEIDRTQGQIRAFQLFTDIDDFYAFILELKDEELLLILSDPSAEKIIPLIHSRAALVSIYILDREEAIDEELMESYSKIGGIFANGESMLQEICNRIQLNKTDHQPIRYISTSSVGYEMVLQECLFTELDYRKQSHEPFLDRARQRYPEQSTLIDEFERTYAPDTSIWWLTRKCFLSSMINDAHRSERLEELFHMGFLFQDIEQQIEKLPPQVNHCSDWTIYRGQGLTESEFESFKSNASNYLSFPKFLCAVTDRSFALRDAHLARNNPQFLGILFQIEIHAPVRYLCLDKHSYSDDSSNAILLSLNGFFRIQEWKQMETYVWQVNLSYVPTNDLELINERQLFSNKYNGKRAWQKLSAYYIEKKQFHRAEMMQKLLIELNFLDDSKQLAILHEQLAFIYDQEKKLDQSLLHYEKSLKFYLTFLSPNDEYLFLIYQQIGILFYEKKQFNQAIKYFKHALTIALHANGLDYLALSDLYHLIGKSFEAEGDWIEAMQNYHSSLENKLSHPSIDFLSIAENYTQIGEIFQRVYDYSTALFYYQKTLSIQQKSLPPNHGLLAMTYYKIAQIYESLQQYKESVESISRALNIARHAFGSEHRQVSMYENFLDQLRKKTKINVIPNGCVYG